MGHLSFPVLLLVLLLVERSALISAAETRVASNSIIVEFEPEAVRQQSNTVGAAQAASVVAASVVAANPQVAVAAAAMPASSSIASALVGAAAADNIRIASYQSYGLVFNGMAVSAATAEDAKALEQKLRADPKVKNIYPDFLLPLQAPIKTKPEAVAAATAPAAGVAKDSVVSAAAVAAGAAGRSSDSVVNNTVVLPLGPNGEDIAFNPVQQWATSDLLTGVAELRSNFRLTGKGIKIGIIDTGVDYTHPAFGSCTGINLPRGQCRVVAGRDFVGDLYTGSADQAKPDNDPKDCHADYHGTTVAGVAAAGYYEGAAMIGVAPLAEIGAYKVYGCNGSAPMSAIIAAIQQAVLDGMDVINLSMSLGPGFPEEPYASVMQHAFALGVLSFKSAGNQGAPGSQGLFWVDAFTGAGSVMVGAAGTSSGVVGEAFATEFSSYGPGASLNLLPHVAAPGANILTTTAANEQSDTGSKGYKVMSGTSHATPYVAGGSALLLQLQRSIAAGKAGKAKVAAAATRRRSSSSSSDLSAIQKIWNSALVKGVTQDALISAVTSTATPLSTDTEAEVPAAVSKSGAGLLNLAAAYYNPIEISPSYISLPSELKDKHIVTITLKNNMKRMAGQNQQYRFQVSHRRTAAALEIMQEWGQVELFPKSGIGAKVAVSPKWVRMGPGQTATVTVTFTLPADLHSKPWLYSGYIDLKPVTKTANSTQVWSPEDRWKPWWQFNAQSSPLPGARFITIPYQGVSQNYSGSLPVIPGPESPFSVLQPGICYAPNTQNVLYPRYSMDVAFDVNACELNTADEEDIRIRLWRIQMRPCDLRITMAPQLPVRRIQLELLDDKSQILGSLPAIQTPVLSRAPAYDSSSSEGGIDASTRINVYSYCLGWRGKYTPVGAGSANATESVQIGKSYKMAAILEAPLALGDAAAMANTPRQVRVVLPGQFTVMD